MTAYHWGVGGFLVVVGGLISLVGIANPQRTFGAAARRDPRGPSQLMHPCPESRRDEPAVTA